MSVVLRRLWPLALTLALGACASPPSAPPVQGQVVGQQSDILAQTRWRLADWTTASGAARALPDGVRGQAPLTMIFTQEQGRPQLSGFAGCNNYMALYRVVNGQLLLTAPPATGRKACAPADMALEQAFLSGLTRITASRLDDDMRPSRLTLTLADGDVLEFARAQDPLVGGQAGQTKLVYVNSARVPCHTDTGRSMCFMVRETDTQPWQIWDGDIVGFTFQPGIDYRLRVVEVRDPQGTGDAPAVRWVLDNVVEQSVARR